MKQPSFTALAAACCLALSLGVSAAPMSRDEYGSAKAEVAARYQAARAACQTKTGQAAGSCFDLAKSRDELARAELEAKYDPSPKNQHELRIVEADAAYVVAREKCNDYTKRARENCFKDAQSAYVKALAEVRAAAPAPEPARPAHPAPDPVPYSR